MYVRELLSYSKIVKFVSVSKINHLDPHDFVKKVNDLKINENRPEITETGQKLRESNAYKNIVGSTYEIVIGILHSLIKNYVSEKT